MQLGIDNIDLNQENGQDSLYAIASSFPFVESILKMSKNQKNFVGNPCLIRQNLI